MISVVAPCLNEEKCLPIFLNSLQNQTFQDFELIIVDGGSKDRSLEIIGEYCAGEHLLVLRCLKRNFGYVRNFGAKHAVGEIMFHCNTDNYFDPRFLERIDQYYRDHPETISLSGRVYPLGTNIIAHVAYQLFDFLRFVFTWFPMPLKKYRPSGSFMTIRTEAFNKIGGYPEVAVNEDGLLGQKLDPLAKTNKKAVAFNLNLYVGHHVKKFEQMGGIQAILFYFYTLTNFAPMLKRLLEPVRRNADLVFRGATLEKLGVRQLCRNLWDWL